MGRFRHDAIVVLGDTDLTELHQAAKEIFEGTQVMVTEVTPLVVNATCSFLVAPDGSKEGWNESDHPGRQYTNQEVAQLTKEARSA